MSGEDEQEDIDEALVAEAVGAFENLPNNALGQISDVISEFNNTPVSEIDPDHARRLVDNLAYWTFSLPVSFEAPFPFYRGRMFDEHCVARSFRQLSYRPPEVAPRAGRANSEGASLFYASTTVETVFAETRARVGSFLNVIECQVRDGERLLVVPIGDIDHVRRYGRTALDLPGFASHINAILGRLPENKAMCVRLVDAFFADWMSRVGEHTYPVTNAVVSEFLSNHISDGVLYRSVAHPGTLNFAIKPDAVDQKVRPVRATAELIIDTFGYGIFRSVRAGPSHEVDPNGAIRWPEQIIDGDRIRWPGNVAAFVDDVMRVDRTH